MISKKTLRKNLPFSHSFLVDMTYNAIMKCSERGFFFFLFFSFFMTVTNAASSAAPGQSGFPPFPPDQELLGEDSFEKPLEQPPKAPQTQQTPPDEPPQEPPEDIPPLPPKDAEHIFYYRGNRTYSENLPLEVYEINCYRVDENTVSLELVFNQSINPRSVKYDSLLIDSNTLPDSIRFSFNRKGDRIKIIVPVSSSSFEVKVQNVCAFDGTMIEPVEMIAQIEEDEETIEEISE